MQRFEYLVKLINHLINETVTVTSPSLSLSLSEAFSSLVNIVVSFDFDTYFVDCSSRHRFLRSKKKTQFLRERSWLTAASLSGWNVVWVE